MQKAGFDRTRLAITSTGMPYFMECKYNFNQLPLQGKMRMWKVEDFTFEIFASMIVHILVMSLCFFIMWKINKVHYLLSA